MPSGRTHDRLTWLSTLPLVGLVAMAGDLGLASVAGLGSLVGGLCFSGDLDTVSRPLRRWGPLAWIWRPYRALVPHRGTHSHGLVWGPVFRLAYLGVILTLVALSLQLACHYAGSQAAAGELRRGGGWLITQISGLPPLPVLAFLGGLFYGNAVHTCSDWTASGARRILRRRRHKRKG